MRFCLNNRNGFSLLELLLVLVCIAAITSWSMHHYQLRQRRAQTFQIQTDIKVIQRALDSYFHIVGCDKSGIFDPSQPLNVSCQTLQQIDSEVVCNRSPLITQYLATVVKTDQNTAGDVPKPIYQLKIQASLDPSLTGGQINWYQKELAAGGNSQGNLLSWDSLPSNSYVQMGDKSWILSGDSAYFRALETQRGTGGDNLPQYSGSFCAE